MRKIERFATLDGLRGIAALSVAYFHIISGFSGHSLLSKAYLAVDFFFALSGFVIAHAYEENLQSAKMKFWLFVKIRLIRLYPLIFLVTLLAYALAVAKYHYDHSISPAGLRDDLIFGLLVVPHSLRGTRSAFPLNSPEWSLFCELVINFIYAGTAAYFIRDRILYLVAVISAAALVFVAAANVIGGTHYGLDTGGLCSQYFARLVRGVFSFSLGVLLYRHYRKGSFKNLPRISGFWLGALLFLSFIPTNFAHGWIYDLFCVFMLYPAIIVFGANANLPGRFAPYALWLGALSYPIYVLHRPIITYSGHIWWHSGLPPVLMHLLTELSIICIAQFIFTFYDAPCRRFLRAWFLPEQEFKEPLALQKDNG